MRVGFHAPACSMHPCPGPKFAGGTRSSDGTIAMVAITISGWAFPACATMQRPRTWCRSLTGSLALNLFFIGAAGALANRHDLQPAPAQTERPHAAAARIDRLAATLPSTDADTLRSQ